MTPSYLLASRLVGFPSSILRVRLVRWVDPQIAVVVTADLQDAGTTLILDAAQLTPEPEAAASRPGA